MAEIDLTNVFNDCVDRIAEGQTLDDCLSRYPQYASMLRPMLEAGLLVRRIRVQPADIMVAQTRVRLRFEDALRAPQPKQSRTVSRFVYAIAAILIIGFVAVGSLATISQNSLPGDPLYSVKTFSEGLQRSLFDNDVLESNFDQRRVQEIQQLLALGRSEDVSFSGVITAQNGTDWIIDSLAITVPLNISNVAAAHIGDKVDVTARTSELRTLTATTIQIIEPAATPLPTIAISTQTPLPMDTATLSATATLTATKPIPTVTPTQVPSSTASAIQQPAIFTPTECTPTRPIGWVSYQIRSGDTLSALVNGQTSSLDELMAANCITDASHIVVGQTIYLPNLPSIAPTAINNSNQGSGSGNLGSSSPTDDHGGDDHGGDDHSGHGGGGSGNDNGGSDDGPGHT